MLVLEANERKIQPVEAWTPKGVKIAEYIQLLNFHGYAFDGSNSATVDFRLCFYQELLNEDGSSNFARHVISEGSVVIPDSVVQNWGADDEPIFDFVIAELGLVKEEV